MMLRTNHHQLRRKLVREGMDPSEAFRFVTDKARDEKQSKKRGKK